MFHISFDIFFNNNGDYADKAFAVMALATNFNFYVVTNNQPFMLEYMAYKHTPARITGAMFELANELGIDMKKERSDLFDQDGFATIPQDFPLPNVVINNAGPVGIMIQPMPVGLCLFDPYKMLISLRSQALLSRLVN